MDVAALDRLPEAVVLLDSEGLVTGVNDRAAHVLDLRDDLVGRPFDELVVLRDDTGSRCSLPLRPPPVGDRLAERVLYHERTDGDTRPIALAGRWTAEGWSITARPAGRRDSLERVHGDVVATVSHEIRSPLSSVKGFTRTLVARWERLNDEQKLAMLRTIDADADRVTHLLRDLLEVSRIDAGRVQLRRSSVDLAALVVTVVDRFAHDDNDEPREIGVQLEDDLPRLEADAERIEQVLTNLLDNAVRYAEGAAIRVTVARDGEGLRLTVADDGPGVEAELRPAVFRKFGRGRRHHGAGTGLGLYISRGLVAAHSGRIWLDDDETGATFHVWLPTGPS